jgi:hypothetical protein
MYRGSTEAKEDHESPKTSMIHTLFEKRQEQCYICLNCNINSHPEILSLCCAGVCHSKCYYTWIQKNNSCPCCGTSFNSITSSDSQIPSLSLQNEPESSMLSPAVVNIGRTIPRRAVSILSCPWTTRTSSDGSLRGHDSQNMSNQSNNTQTHSFSNVPFIGQLRNGSALSAHFLCSMSALPMFFLCTSIVICNYTIKHDPVLKKCPNKFLPQSFEDEPSNVFGPCARGIIVGVLYFVAFIFIFETVYSHFRPLC